jgi:ubiquinone/menaquinone biosynthesis C-methylase UbiE
MPAGRRKTQRKMQMRAAAVLRKVKTDYSDIADEFNAARNRPWPEFYIFLNHLLKTRKKPEKMKLLDVGCGNGRPATREK